jgi:hypothetical protein
MEKGPREIRRNIQESLNKLINGQALLDERYYCLRIICLLDKPDSHIIVSGQVSQIVSVSE